MKRILFVCTGNICRSPTAEGVARTLVEKAGRADEFEFDSAGFASYHIGEAPDPRAVRVAATRGYDLSALRARRVQAEDYERFDWLLAMDAEHLDQLQRKCPKNLQHKVRMFTFLAKSTPINAEVPDPYYGGNEGFVHVLDVCEDAVLGLLEKLK